jgi:hypothetical protein
MPDKKGLTTLYKFRPYSDEERRARAHALLEGHLWFSPLREFNDPFEGRPRFVPAFSNPEEQKQAYIKDVKRIAMERGLPGSERFALVERARNRPADTYMTLGLPEGLRHLLANECFVFSLSATRAHPLQWSHYANEHRGICIHFDSEKWPISGAMRAEYAREYPAISIPRSGDEHETFVLSALTKAEYWIHEDEYRIVSVRETNPTWDLGLTWDPEARVAICDPKIVTGLTFGARMPPDAKAGLLKWCKANRPDISVAEAVLGEDKFELTFRDL